MHADPHVEAAIDFLRGHTRGDLRFDAHIEPIKYVIAPDGRLIAPVMVAMLSAGENVLHVPDDREGSMELMLSLEEFTESGRHGALADRWRIYHGEPRDVRWATMRIDAARFQGMFIDGEALLEANPLAGGESALCREINNGHVAALRKLCSERGGMDVDKPVLVGIDSRGADVRSAFDIVRIRFDSPAATVEQAREALLR